MVVSAMTTAATRTPILIRVCRPSDPRAFLAATTAPPARGGPPDASDVFTRSSVRLFTGMWDRGRAAAAGRCAHEGVRSPREGAPFCRNFARRRLTEGVGRDGMVVPYLTFRRYVWHTRQSD